VDEYRSPRLPICAAYRSTVLSSSEDSSQDDDDQVDRVVSVARLKKKINDYDSLYDSDYQTSLKEDSEMSESSVVSQVQCSGRVSRDRRAVRTKRRPRSLPRLPTEEHVAINDSSKISLVRFQ